MNITTTEVTVEVRKLTPSKGMTLYDGTTLSKEVYLGINDTPDRWREITDEEADAIREKNSPQAEEGDYLESLERFGVTNDEG